LQDVVAKYSEAQTGCPVSYTYTRREGSRLLERHGFHVTDVRVEHIFPYRIPDYIKYQYVKEWYFRWMPQLFFRSLERRFGWHLLLTANPSEYSSLLHASTRGLPFCLEFSGAAFKGAPHRIKDSLRRRSVSSKYTAALGGCARAVAPVHAAGHGTVKALGESRVQRPRHAVAQRSLPSGRGSSDFVVHEPQAADGPSALLNTSEAGCFFLNLQLSNDRFPSRALTR
jgi:hypothetical protein